MDADGDGDGGSPPSAAGPGEAWCLGEGYGVCPVQEPGSTSLGDCIYCILFCKKKYILFI